MRVKKKKNPQLLSIVDIGFYCFDPLKNARRIKLITPTANSVDPKMFEMIANNNEISK